jgi:hypothetical protein
MGMRHEQLAFVKSRIEKQRFARDSFAHTAKKAKNLSTSVGPPTVHAACSTNVAPGGYRGDVHIGQ